MPEIHHKMCRRAISRACALLARISISLAKLSYFIVQQYIGAQIEANDLLYQENPISFNFFAKFSILPILPHNEISVHYRTLTKFGNRHVFWLNFLCWSRKKYQKFSKVVSKLWNLQLLWNCSILCFKKLISQLRYNFCELLLFFSWSA